MTVMMEVISFFPDANVHIASAEDGEDKTKKSKKSKRSKKKSYHLLERKQQTHMKGKVHIESKSDN